MIVKSQLSNLCDWQVPYYQIKIRLMLKNILKSLQDAGDVVMDKASEINDAAKDKVMSVINEWVEILPKLMSLGLEMTSFGISMSISPCMLAELKGNTSDFSEDKIKSLLETYQNDKSIKLFLNVLKTTMALHKKTNATMKDEIIVRLEVKLSPEIKVFIGRPELT